MTDPIAQTLSNPSEWKKTEYNIISTISDNMNKELQPLQRTIASWGNKVKPSWQKNNILNGNQITIIWEKREEKWKKRRSNLLP